MNGTGWFIAIVIIAVIAILFWFNTDEKRYRRVVRSSHEWLWMFDTRSWKNENQVKERMSTRKGKKVAGATVYLDLVVLEDEKLIESHSGPNGTTEYRLTAKGMEFRDKNTKEAP